MIIIRNDILPFKGYKAMTVWPFIFVRNGSTFNSVDETHERIHGQQQKELLLIGLYILDAISALVRWIHYRNWKEAYRSIPFEVEAYFWQNYPHYLEHRHHYAWRKNLFVF